MFKPVPQPPPVDNGQFDGWAQQLYRDATRRSIWTPSFSFATPGDLSVSYTAAGRLGWINYDPSGQASAWFAIVTSAFTHTTASGALSITGLPSSATDETNFVCVGSLQWQGITKANYTQWFPYILAGTSSILVSGCGSGQPNVSLSAADMPTGGTIVLFGKLDFRT